MSLPNIFGPDRRRKTPQEILEEEFGLTDPSQIDDLSQEQVDEALRAIGGPEAVAAMAFSQITELVAGLFNNSLIGPERTIEFLEGILDRLRGHVPGAHCHHCGTDTPPEGAN